MTDSKVASAALQSAIATMKTQEQLLEWVDKCDWNVDGAMDISSIMASSAWPEFIPGALDRIIEHSLEPTAQVRRLALYAGAIIACENRSEIELAEELTRKAIDHVQSMTPPHDRVHILGSQIKIRLEDLGESQVKMRAIDRLFRVARSHNALCSQSALSKSIVDACIESVLKGPGASKRLLAAARSMIDRGIILEAEVLSKMDNAPFRKVNGYSQASYWPGTWVSICQHIEEQPNGSIGTRHARRTAHEIAIQHISANGKDVQRHAQNLIQNATSLVAVQEGLVLLDPDQTPPWCVSKIHGVCSQAGTRGRGTFNHVVLMLAAAKNEEAWGAVPQKEKLELFTSLISGEDPDVFFVDKKLCVVDPNENQCGKRLADMFPAQEARDLAYGFVTAASKAVIVARWIPDILESAIHAHQMELNVDKPALLNRSGPRF